jgi:hypothetical protein
MGSRGWAAAALCALAIVMALPPAAAIYAIRDPSYSCVVDALPTSRASVDPLQPIVGQVTLIPLGLECAFTSMNGRATTLKPDWVLTVMVGASAASVLAAGIVAILGISRRRALADAQGPGVGSREN